VTCTTPPIPIDLTPYERKVYTAIAAIVANSAGGTYTLDDVRDAVGFGHSESSVVNAVFRMKRRGIEMPGIQLARSRYAGLGGRAALKRLDELNALHRDNADRILWAHRVATEVINGSTTHWRVFADLFRPPGPIFPPDISRKEIFDLTGHDVGPDRKPKSTAKNRGPIAIRRLIQAWRSPDPWERIRLVFGSLPTAGNSVCRRESAARNQAMTTRS